MRKARFYPAFSLLEIIVAVAIFAVFGVVLMKSLIGVPFDNNNSLDRVQATQLLTEGEEALLAMRNYDFASLSAGGPHGLGKASGYWEFDGTSDSFGKFTRTVTLTTIDDARLRADIDVSWTTDEGVSQTIDSVLWLTLWEGGNSFLVDTEDDFNEGSYNGTSVYEDGYIELSPIGDFEDLERFAEIDFDGDGEIRHIEAYGDYLYVSSMSTSGQEFVQYDQTAISSGTLTENASLEVGANVYDFVFISGYAILATAGDELRVVDLSSMSIVDTVNLSGSEHAYTVALSGSDLIVGRESGSNGEVYVFDASDPANLSSVTPDEIEVGDDVNNIKVADGYAFLGTDDGSDELKVLRLSDNTIVNELNLAGEINELSLSADGTELFVAMDGGSAEWARYDVSDPEGFGSGDLLDSWNTSEQFFSVTSNGVYAVVGWEEEDNLFSLIDLSTGLDVATFEGGDEDNAIHAVYMFGNHVAIGGSTDAGDANILEAYYAPVSEEWSVLNEYALDLGDNRNMYDVMVDGNYAYAVRDSEGSCDDSDGDDCEFLVVDISTPSSPTLVAGVEIGADANSIYLHDGYAYIANDGTELLVYDISSPSSPSLVGSYNTNSGANGEGVYGVGDYVFIGTRNNTGTCNQSTGVDCELHILDIGNVGSPSSPQYVAGVEIGENVFEVHAQGSYVYVGTAGTELYIIDVSTPASPSKSSVNLSGSGDLYGMEYRDSQWHFVRGTSGANDTYLQYPGLDGEYTASPERDVTVYGDYAFIGGDENSEEFEVWDISTPSAMVKLGSLNIGGDINGLHTDDGVEIVLASEGNNDEIVVVTDSAVASGNYAANGSYYSKVFDSGSSATTWGNYTLTTSGSGTVDFYVRTADSSANLSSAIWVQQSGGTISVDSGASGTRYLEFRLDLFGDGSSSPQVDSVEFEYN